MAARHRGPGCRRFAAHTGLCISGRAGIAGLRALALEPPHAPGALRPNPRRRHLAPRRPAGGRGYAHRSGSPPRPASRGSPNGPARGLSRAQTVAVQLVVRALGPQRRRQRQMPAGLLGPAGFLERPSEAELREVVDRIAVHDRLELHRRSLVTAAAEIRAAQCLPDRALLRLHLPCLLERNGRREEVAVLEQLAAAPVQVVDLLAPLFGCHAVAPVRTRNVSTTSTIAAATADLGPRGTWVTPAAVTIVTSFWSDSKPIAGSEMSFTTTASTRLRSSFIRPFAAGSPPCS